MSHLSQRRYPVGAELLTDGVSFRVWAPDHKHVALAIEGGSEVALEPEGNGYFSGLAGELGAGSQYRFALGKDKTKLPDPASRYQPEGVEGPSQVVDPHAFQWSDAGWRGAPEDPVYYELHVGTFTQEGTFTAAIERLAWLKEMGITVIEMMPLHAFSGQFGWGYDGVLLFAPFAPYGSPDDVRRFVDRAHALGIAVILDVVYNHFGPGEICPRYAEAYFNQGPANEWGRGMNFDGPDSEPVREFFISNAAYWIDEFHFDGLRIDATQALLDDSPEHIITALGKAARAAAGDRHILLVSENERQETFQVRPPDREGYGLDALWNDDFHHSARVALLGRSEAYFHDHHGAPQEFISAAKYGYLFQGQRYDWQDAQRGHAGFDLMPANFIHFIQNHDQIANTPGGRRLTRVTSPAQLRAMTALLLLGPQAPLLFQGQEFGATTCFSYFFDQHGELAEAVWKGRRDFIAQFPSLDQQEARDEVPAPHAPSTFHSSKLDWSEAERHSEIVALYRDLLTIRRETPALRRSRGQRSVDGAVVGRDAFLLRFFGEDAHQDRALIINLGSDIMLRSIPDPLWAPPKDHKWKLAWSSEMPRYGGNGQRSIDTFQPWGLTGQTALMFEPEPGERQLPASKDELDRWQYELRTI